MDQRPGAGLLGRRGDLARAFGLERFEVALEHADQVDDRVGALDRPGDVAAA